MTSPRLLIMPVLSSCAYLVSVRRSVRPNRPVQPFIDGTWLVPTYRWEQGVPLNEKYQGPAGPWLVPHPKPGLLQRQQAPNDAQRRLYREFCALDPTDQEALKRFANSYGLLGDGGPGDRFTVLVGTRSHRLGVHGMSQQAWRYA